MNVTLTLQNPLKYGDYIAFTSSLDLLSQLCTVFNNLPLYCYIDSGK